jgi:hypothetical protein
VFICASKRNQAVQLATPIVVGFRGANRLIDFVDASFVAAHDVDSADRRTHDDLTGVVSAGAEGVERSGVVVERMSARERNICTNATRFTLEALMCVGLVDDAAVIAVCRDSSAGLRLATLGMSRTLPSGRLDLAARRRFDVPRDAALRPLVLPPRSVPTIPGETAVLKFLLNEAEHEWIRMVPSSDHRAPLIPRFPLSHRDARS